MYSITITQGNEIYKGKGKDALEALQSVVKPLKITGKVNLSITDGKRKADQLYMPVRAKRLFFPLAQTYIAKQLEYLMR